MSWWSDLKSSINNWYENKILEPFGMWFQNEAEPKLDELRYGKELSLPEEMAIAQNEVNKFQEKQEHDGLTKDYEPKNFWDKVKAWNSTFSNLWQTATESLKGTASNVIDNTIEMINKGEATPDKETQEIIDQANKDLINNNLGTEEIPDTTDTNIETPLTSLNYDQIKADMLAERDALWAREDAIRKETQEREDTAYQRAVDDMRAAGINPNLVGISPANSGGGITSATGTNYTPLQVQSQQEIAALGRDLEEFLKMYETSVNNEFKGDENEKDRFLDAAGKVLTAFISYKFFKGRK